MQKPLFSTIIMSLKDRHLGSIWVDYTIHNFYHLRVMSTMQQLEWIKDQTRLLVYQGKAIFFLTRDFFVG